MSWLSDPVSIPERVERAMADAGWPETKRQLVRDTLAADNGPAKCPHCSAGLPDFRPARPGDRLTWFCSSCGEEGPPEALVLVRELLRLEYAS